MGQPGFSQIQSPAVGTTPSLRGPGEVGGGGAPPTKKRKTTEDRVQAAFRQGFLGVLVGMPGTQFETKLFGFTSTSHEINAGRVAKPSANHAFENKLVLETKHVSKHHARFKMMYPQNNQANKMKRLYVQDKSTNGTFVNDKRVKKDNYQLLEEGDVVDFLPPNEKKTHVRVAFKLTYASADAIASRALKVAKLAKEKELKNNSEDGGEIMMIEEPHDNEGKVMGGDMAYDSIGDVYAGGHVPSRFAKRLPAGQR